MPDMTMPAPRPSSPSPSVAAGAHLRVVNANGEAGRFALPGEHGVVIGAAPNCDLRLTDTYVSRRHASIHPSGDRFLLDDLGSANGTTLNGRRLHGQEPLRSGDLIGVGRTTLTFTPAEPGRDSPPPRRAPERGPAALLAAGAGLVVAGALAAYAAVFPGLGALTAGLIILSVGVRRARGTSAPHRPRTAAPARSAEAG